MASTSEIVRIFGDAKEDAKEIYNEFMEILSEKDESQRNNLLTKKIKDRRELIQLGIFRDMKELANTLFNKAIKKNAVGLCTIMMSNLPELLNSRDENGNGPQHIYANYYEKIQPAHKLFQLLFNEKTDLKPNNNGANPIHVAAEKIGGASMLYASRFIKKFEDIRLFDTWFLAKDNRLGWTPLMYRLESRGITAFLQIPSIFEYHVTRNIKSDDGHNIFHFAAFRDLPQVMEKCMEYCMSSTTHPQNDKDKLGRIIGLY